jgi:regulator of replication initiation timing
LKKRRLDESNEVSALKKTITSLTRAGKGMKEQNQTLMAENTLLKHQNRMLRQPRQELPVTPLGDVNMQEAPHRNVSNDNSQRENSLTYHSRSRSASPTREREDRDGRRRVRSPIRKRIGWEDDSHADAQGGTADLVGSVLQHQRDPTQATVHQSTSFSLSALLNPVPRENLIAKLLAFPRQQHSVTYTNTYYEIFLVTRVGGQADIEGISFLATTSQSGVQQVEILMDHINTWWTTAKREPGPLIASERGKVVINNAKVVHAACAQQGTCFVGSKEDVEKILQLGMEGHFEL